MPIRIQRRRAKGWRLPPGAVCVDMAFDKMRDRLADIGDAAKDRAKEDGTWPPTKK